MKLQLRWYENNQAQEVIATTPIYIGRNKEENDIVIHNKNISRRHACLMVKDGQLIIIDLNSQNGVFIRGIRVQEGRIPQHGHIQIANIPFQVTALMPSDSVNEIWSLAEKQTLYFSPDTDQLDDSNSYNQSQSSFPPSFFKNTEIPISTLHNSHTPVEGKRVCSCWGRTW